MRGHSRRGLRPWTPLFGGAVIFFGICGVYGCIDSDTTTFGNPNVLARANLPGEAGAAVTTVSDSCSGTFTDSCPSFQTDIYPYFPATGKWQCASSACHGGSTSPKLSCDTADDCYTSLLAVPAIEGKQYINPSVTDPTQDAMLCSLQGSCGDKMPRPPGQDPTPDDLCIISAWLKCGAPR